MRTVTAFLLTTLILINLFGFYAIFMVKQTEIKSEMRESVSKSKSSGTRETLSFHKNEFDKLPFDDNGKELHYEGKLYDVVTIEKNDSEVNVTVEYDVKETTLIDTLMGELNQQQDKDQTSSPLKAFLSHFQQDYIANQHYTHLPKSDKITSYCVVNSSYPSSTFMTDNLTPPPQFILV